MTVASLLIAVCHLTSQAEIVLDERAVRVGDVLDLACISPEAREDIADLVIAEIPAGVTRMDVSQAGLEALARRRVPGLEFASSGTDGLKITFRTPAVQAEATPVSSCFAAARAIEAGGLVTRKDLAAAPCSAEPAERALTFDRVHGVLRAQAPITSGAYLGRVAAPESAVDAGEALTLRISVGPVQIERDVWAVQAAAGGAGIFVRDNRGEVIRSTALLPPDQEASHD
jgi:flagella basal body P-ring formation protein FlgA